MLFLANLRCEKFHDINISGLFLDSHQPVASFPNEFNDSSSVEKTYLPQTLVNEDAVRVWSTIFFDSGEHFHGHL